MVKTWWGKNQLLVQKSRSTFIADIPTYKVSETGPAPRADPTFPAHKNIQ